MRKNPILPALFGLAIGLVIVVPAASQDRSIVTAGTATEADRVIGNIRDTYVDQFRSYAEPRNGDETGATEIKIELNHSDRLFRKLICVDYLRKTADGPEPEIFEPERQLYFDDFEARIGGVTVAFSSFGWDGVEVRYESAKSIEEILGPWFEYWFDPDDERRDTTALLNGNIHTLVAFEGGVSIDMGTAPSAAFHEMIAAFEKAGVARLEIGGEI